LVGSSWEEHFRSNKVKNWAGVREGWHGLKDARENQSAASRCANSDFCCVMDSKPEIFINVKLACVSSANH
jgi:hypothetical protein